MKQAARGLCVLVVALLSFGAVSGGDATTLEGEFVWNRSDGDRTGPLKAVFTPTGESTWDVAFHFDWEDGPHVYTGTAEGSLAEGALSGVVENDSAEREVTFHFKGATENGKFSGTHGSVQEDGSLRDLGTLWLGSAN
jgi:hypothetical protein